MIAKTSPQLTEKIAEVYEELKRTSLWQNEVPEWVHHYQKEPQTQVEFSEWLQFVFLPNKVQGNKLIDFGNIAPQAVKFFGNDIQRGRLLQLLVELDSLS
jgi:uncharacterized protein YqcC (DUF446 family)